jgi:NCS1 family nucleobase:cation symporter-1
MARMIINFQRTPREPVQFALESNSVNFIPHHLRHGRAWTLFPLWFGANCAIFTIAVGATAVFPSLSVPWAILALILGSLIGGIFMAYHSAQGPKLGIPQMIQSRAQFGLYGANLPLLIVVAMYVGFFAAGDVIVGQAIQQLSHLSLSTSIIIGSAASFVLVLFGYNVVHWFERAATPLFLAVFIIFTVMLAVTGPPAASSPRPRQATQPGWLPGRSSSFFPQLSFTRSATHPTWRTIRATCRRGRERRRHSSGHTPAS